MILRRLARRPTAIQCLASACRTAPSARRLHYVPTLANHAELQQNGIPGLYSPDAFREAYTDYMQHTIDQLNACTAGTAYEDQKAQSLVIEYARNPVTAYPFNVASMAWNNHFFFTGINTDADMQSKPASDLLPAINESFSSLETLRESFLETANAMFGPGFVWLVQTNDNAARKLRILPTYLAGSPLSGAHYRRQSEDLNTHNADSYQGLNNVGSFGPAAQQKKQNQKPLGGIDVVPLLCVNTWEHAWLRDYGVAGKRQYLEAWWDKINWGTVRNLATIASQDHEAFGQGHRKFHY
ncbi:Manganese/iron superoxide dismutase [Massariosphaeria phaeospora]|uniref:Manganese/iron superoxide dismutase n=1 Tax=Massariosphaeria phaeospora TaxID=100035 RepID=A0A7C8IKI3_9PLEO|nr:Manganese/iron superoxide dismutase [Massariosphaeria phaeospora]